MLKTISFAKAGSGQTIYRLRKKAFCFCAGDYNLEEITQNELEGIPGYSPDMETEGLFNISM
jgi:hypothetical protein